MNIVTQVQKDFFNITAIGLAAGLITAGVSFLVAHFTVTPLDSFATQVEWVPVGALAGTLALSIINGIKTKGETL